MTGHPRDGFHRFEELCGEADRGPGGAAQAAERGRGGASRELARRKPLLANRTAPEVEAPIVELSLELPAYGRVRKPAGSASAATRSRLPGVRGVWQRHDLETMRKRRRALEARSLPRPRSGVAQEGLILAESQLAALERAEADEEAHGEFESERPGHGRGAGHLSRVGTMKGVGRIRPADLRRHPLRGGPRPRSTTAGPRSPRPIRPPTGWCRSPTRRR
jgi:hypothetical protein